MKWRTLTLFSVLPLFFAGGLSEAQTGNESADFLQQDIEPPLVFQDTSIIDAIVVLAQRHDVSIRRKTSKIDGVVSGQIKGVSVSDWLDHLSRLYGFYWYYDVFNSKLAMPPMSSWM